MTGTSHTLRRTQCSIAREVTRLVKQGAIMEYRRLGNTGVYISVVSLGTMTFGGSANPIWGAMGGLDLPEADRIVGTALDAGINSVVTADAYGDGETEEIVGKALGARRKDVFLTTKFAMRMGPGPNDGGVSRLHIMRALEDSLRRLGTDHIDLYQAHVYDSATSLEDILSTLDTAVRQGKICYIGASNITAWQTMKALEVSQRRALERYSVIESYYSLAGRDIETELLPMTIDQGLGHLVYSPLAGGLLSGKYSRIGSPDGASRRVAVDMPPADHERVFDIVDRLRIVADRHDAGVPSVALAWVLARPGVTAVIVGARRPEQLVENIEAAELRLTDIDLAELDEVSRPVVPPYPLYMQELYAAVHVGPQAGASDEV
jgi:aryl-alcohol dehydrogenase-like predicted oxidoreductase